MKGINEYVNEQINTGKYTQLSDDFVTESISITRGYAKRYIETIAKRLGMEYWIEDFQNQINKNMLLVHFGNKLHLLIAGDDKNQNYVIAYSQSENGLTDYVRMPDRIGSMSDMIKHYNMLGVKTNEGMGEDLETIRKGASKKINIKPSELLTNDGTVPVTANPKDTSSSVGGGGKIKIVHSAQLREIVLSSQSKANLNHLDVSGLTDLDGVFVDSIFNGDISEWDVSNVTSLNHTFRGSLFKGNISKWNVSNVKSMVSTFEDSAFVGDLSKWDVSKCEMFIATFKNTGLSGVFAPNNFKKWNVSSGIRFTSMFEMSTFNGDISNWNTGRAVDMSFMFRGSNFKGDLSKWNVSNVMGYESMFADSQFSGDLSKWNVGKARIMARMFEGVYVPFDLKAWKPKGVMNTDEMFLNAELKFKLPKWPFETVNAIDVVKGSNLESFYQN